jgi:predicted small secreted protein
MRITVKRLSLLTLLALFPLSGCNTADGMGRDLSAAGTAMSQSADEIRDGK